MPVTAESLRSALASRYDIEREIGSGGMAIIYGARDQRHNRAVAIKVLRPELATLLGPERFLQEIQMASQLQHPQILPVLDSGDVDGLPYYVMPLVQGESLRDRIEREGPLPVNEAVRIAAEVGDALAYAHSRGIIHRDIKPENILLSAGHAVVADFGIARAVLEAGAERITSSGIVVGSPAYMSPEQADAEARVDGRADEYALGCVVHEMLVGEPPFTGPTAQVVLSRHAQERPPSITVARPGVPAYIVAAVEKSLSKFPADRYPSVQGLVKALTTPTAWQPPVGARRRAARRAAGVALLVVAAFGLWKMLAPPGPPLDANKVVVFPLLERGLSAADSGAGYDVALVLQGALEHSEPLKGLDGWRGLSHTQRADVSALSLSQLLDAARRLGARYFVDGVVRRAGDSSSVVLRLYDVQGDSDVAQQTASGSTSAAPAYRLALSAIQPLLPRLLDPGRPVDLTALANRQAGAVALWIQGERAYRTMRFGRALDLYKRAIGLDSSLVVAAVKGAQAASWENRMDEAGALAALAVARDSLLPRRYGFFARGIAAYVAGQADTALAWLERAVREAPDWSEAHTARGEVAYHLLPSGTSPESLARAEFETAARLDPDFRPPALHLAEVALRHADLRRADRYISRLRESQADSLLLRQLTLERACVRGEMDADAWRRAATQNIAPVLDAARSLAPGGLQAACAQDAFRASAGSGSAAYDWGAFLGLQGLMAARGRTRQLAALVDSFATAGPGMARALFFLDALAGLPLDSEATRVALFLRATFGDSLDGLGDSENAARTRWMAGAWYAAQGDVARTAALASALARQARARPSRTIGLYSRALGAHLALLRGDSAAALAALRALVPNGPRETLSYDLGEPLPVERLRLAQLALQRGEPEEALRVAEVFDHPQPIIFLPFVPASLELRARAAQALGRAKLAAEYRNRLRRLAAADAAR